MPASPHRESAIAVAIADMATLTKLLPRRIVPISFSGFSRIPSTILTPRLCFFATWRRRTRLTVMRAVSEPEKKAEQPSNSTINIHNDICGAIPKPLMLYLLCYSVLTDIRLYQDDNP